ENHFVKVGPDVFSNQTSPEVFQRYLDAWEEAMVLGRMSCAETAPQGFHRVEMNAIRLVGLPDFYGPEQYLRNLRRCRAMARNAIVDVGSIILRSPGTVSNLVWSLIRGTGRPFGLEVLGDPGSSMGRGSTRHPLRPFFRWWYVSSLKR